MRSFLERLAEGETLVADGAMGTLLFERGLKPGECPESINLEEQKTLEEIAGLYLAAGADIIETNTFGASSLKLSRYGLEAEIEAINQNAVRAVRNVVGDRAYVAASCGPCGRLLKPHGDADPDLVFDSYMEQMQCLIEAGIDCVCIETMTDLAEATLAVKAAKMTSRDVPVTATMTFDATPKGFRTIMGVSIAQAASVLAEAGADVIGSNCGNGIEQMIEIARAFRETSELPLIIQSNAGLPAMKDGRLVYSETPTFMAAKVVELIDAGVSIIGGCCGTTPEHISAMSEAVDMLGRTHKRVLRS